MTASFLISSIRWLSKRWCCPAAVPKPPILRLRPQPGNTLIFADDLARAAVQAGGPVVRRNDRVELAEHAQCLGAVVDQLPGTGDAGVDFAVAVLRTAAWAIQQMLGATRNGANAHEFTQSAIAATGAFFCPDAL
jgi:hypothetical protein